MKQLIQLFILLLLLPGAEAQMITGSRIYLHNLSYGAGFVRTIGLQPYFPSDTLTNHRPMALIIDLAGSGQTTGGAVAGGIANGLNLTYVINPLTRDTVHFMNLVVYDSTSINPANALVLPQVLAYVRARWNIDSTRIYGVGWSYGGLQIIDAANHYDSVGKYMAAIVPMSAGSGGSAIDWTPPNYFGDGDVGNGAELQTNHCMIWHMQGKDDPIVTLAAGIAYEDSILKYIGTNQYHFTEFLSGPLDTHGNWDLKTSDTLGVDLSFWNWSDNSTLGRGGKPFYGSIYSWFLLFRNSLTPGGNTSNLTAMSQVNGGPVGPFKVLPIIKHAFMRRRDANFVTLPWNGGVCTHLINPLPWKTGEGAWANYLTENTK